MGMQNDATAMGNCMAISPELHIELSHNQTTPHLGMHPKYMKAATQILLTYAPINITHNAQKVEAFE